MRLEDERSVNKIAVVSRFLQTYTAVIVETDFIVVTETNVRITKMDR